ncbi:hypothetical protein Ptr86124_003467 [Pyrenophora tritici-repentis]|uniref:Uncharacterized protein n=2 Tax=Pyrenophora tritici-repentis TaxID=45151 RepID=A0A922NLM4_9PLEO|nr:hypothetical protein Ptr86124_003467 [Pyrenophora tritici-repentis]
MTSSLIDMVRLANVCKMLPHIKVEYGLSTAYQYTIIYLNMGGNGLAKAFLLAAAYSDLLQGEPIHHLWSPVKPTREGIE